MAAGGTAPGARRPKAALFLLSCLAAGLAPHWLPEQQRLWPALALTLLLGAYALRTVFLPLLARAAASGGDTPEATAAVVLQTPDPWPSIDLVVAARDEEAVIGRLVERLAQVRYPDGRLRFWALHKVSSF